MAKRNENTPPPPYSWPEVPIDRSGLDPKKLEAWWKLLKKNNTNSIFVMHKDKVVFERYADGFGRQKPHYTASMAKALTGGMSLLFAIQDGLIKFDDLAYKYVPQWKNDPLKSKITIAHLATHTSGISDSSVSGFDHQEEPGWKGVFWQRNPVPNDPFTLARDQAPVLFEPGTKYQYSNPAIAMLTYCVTKALQKGPHKDIRTLLQERLMGPMSIPENEWGCGYGQTFEVDGLPLVGTWGGGNFSVRATAAIIRLLMRKGAWGKDHLLKANIVEDAFVNAGLLPNLNGHVWWVNSDGKGNKHQKCLPEDAFWGSGAGCQIGMGIPSLDLIMVRNGQDPLDIKKASKSKKRVTDTLRDRVQSAVIFAPLINSIPTLKAPYPQSEKITACTWENLSNVRRSATGGLIRDGSDNWPMTWAEDNHQYTAYGDGNGFAPYTPNKLGMGFAKIEGGSGNFTATNIRSNAENTSYGQNDRKASGLLCVDGTLYLLARNDNQKGHHSRIGWSTDHMRTFQWAKWNFKELGHPTFINFGKNYEDAQDGFVYIWSNDHPSAYKESDHFVLARVPKDQILQRDAYEFFVHLKSGKAIWSSDIKKRGPVFKFPNTCIRSSISYNAGIKRYILWQNLRQAGGEDTRFSGGFGVYEAPNPWGPWKTVYFTNKWDIGPGELGCFPTKWMRKDGKTMYLVSSSDDQFTVRKVKLSVK
ncbi:MAG: CubicO group peptidase (beta-lactamase class C family) [Candidatus Latescibacterota bacterium]|jgi:CubicO group peptidase (beta-lactamase class C family)